MLQGLIKYIQSIEKDKETTKTRIYLEKMESILQRPKKVIGTDSGGGSLNLLPLNEVFKD